MKIKLVLTKFSITPEIGLNEKGFKTIERSVDVAYECGIKQCDIRTAHELAQPNALFVWWYTGKADWNCLINFSRL